MGLSLLISCIAVRFLSRLNGSVQEMLVLKAYSITQMPQINTHADEFREARGQNVGLNLHLYAYVLYANSEGSGESAISTEI